MEKILITGVTGIVGSHVLYELLEQVVSEGRNCELHVLIRAANQEEAHLRFENEVWKKGLLPKKLRFLSASTIIDHINIIPGSLTDCEIPDELGNHITLYHLAASVNLSSSNSGFKDIYTNNYQATQVFLNKLENRIKKINFISTAFSSGDRFAVIQDDYHSGRRHDFRNPYEQYKHKLEAELLERSAQGEFECTIMRPSVVCGRVIKEPHYVMSRYVVFYMIGAFLTKMKKKFGAIEKFRMVADPNGSLNIVPVDYAAKAIVRGADSNLKQLNITLSKNVPNRLWIPIIIDKVGVENFEFVSEEPQDPTPIEKMYYKLIGSQLTKYIKTSKHIFLSHEVRTLMSDIEEPDLVELFEEIYDFAHSNEFRLAA